ncbi:MAG: ATP-binding protein, partial [Eubacteriaceae bacterium]
EPVVNDILYNPDNFPSIECPLINVDTALSYGIHNQVKDDNAANRLLKFLWIWGNGQPEQYTKDGTTYISAISEAILSELGLPVISFSEVDEPINSDTNYLKQNEISEPVQDERKINKIPLSVKERVSKVNSVLTDWSNGQAINISQTGGVMGSIKKAQDDICSYLLSSINWQAEGIPNDNINKVKRSSSKIKLVSLENQTKGNGFYVLPASWDSMNVISAFVRWREYGMQSWNYPDSDFDAYLITSWSSQIKNDVIKAISDKADPLRISYIEAAVTAEMYQLILRGEFTGNSLEKLSVKSLFNSTFSQCEENNHCKEWNELLKLLSRYDSGNRKTIRQYFNIIQGPDEAKVVILNEPELARIVKKVKANKLNVVEEDLQLDDQVTLRQKVFENLKIISDRINSVANAEIVKAKAAMKIIYDQFDSDEIEEEDILDLVDASKKFYSEINNAQINIPVASTDAVKKSAKQIAKVTSKIGEVLLNNDVLVILMTFSGDPLSTLQPLIELLDVLNKDVRKLDQRLAVKETSLKRRQEGEDSENQYSIEQNMIATDISIAENLR